MRTLDDLRAAMAAWVALERKERPMFGGRSWYAEDVAVIRAARALVDATASAPRTDGEDVMCFLTLEEWEAVKAARAPTEAGDDQ
jgi:hypothetical protein